MFFRSFKYAYQRIVRGYANCDTFDLDNYYLDIFYNTLTHLADNHCAYPGDNEFDTDEKWTAYLKEMADCFYRANEANNFYDTPETDKWWAWSHSNAAGWRTNNGIAEETYVKNMLNEEAMLSKKRQQDMEKGMDMLKHTFFDLWD
jgi:hypothetical protein